MGSDSDGPLAVAWDPKPDDPDIYHSLLSFVDPGTFEFLRCAAPPWEGSGPVAPTPSGGSLVASGRHLQIRASAVGNLFGIWTPRAGATCPTPSSSTAGRSRVAAVSGLGYVAPQRMERGPHGSSQRAHGGSGRLDPAALIPSADPRYYLAVYGLPDPRPATVEARPGPIEIIVNESNSKRPLFRVTDLPEMEADAAGASSTPEALTVEKHFHLIPAAKLLITIPHANDRLVLRRLDVEKAAVPRRVPSSSPTIKLGDRSGHSSRGRCAGPFGTNPESEEVPS